MNKSTPKTNNVAARRIAPARKPLIKRLGSAVVDTAKDKQVQIVVGGSLAVCALIITGAVLADKYLERN